MMAADIAYLVRGAAPTPSELGRAACWITSLAHWPPRKSATPSGCSLISCTLTAILSLWVAVPLGYLLSRYQFRGKWLHRRPARHPHRAAAAGHRPESADAVSRFHRRPPAGRLFARAASISGDIHASRSVVLAQFAVACAFAVRTMRVTFDGLSPRHEQVALTLGCSRAQAFWRWCCRRRGAVW